MNFLDHLTQCQQRINTLLPIYLPSTQQTPSVLHQAMHYMVLGNGKRLRPAIVYTTGLALSHDSYLLDLAACAIEIIHVYSLIHDDLPAMDNSELRHGKLTCHCAFDEATAILAGDALQALAFQILTTSNEKIVKIPEYEKKQLQMVMALAKACSSTGMVGGQALDLAFTHEQPTIMQLEQTAALKTGALIRCAVEMALIATGITDQNITETLNTYAHCISLAFQIHDDILDVVGKTEDLGKESGKDKSLEKATYPTVLGLDGAKRQRDLLVQQALQELCHLKFLGPQIFLLQTIAEHMINRDH